jgi:uroporphyrinogen decarboxylase
MPSLTLSKKERFLGAVRCEEVDRPPIWIMRQAGRYMPEYQALRAQHGFRDFCLRPEVAAAATLLPHTLLDPDILIIFNDILIPLEAMGLEVEFPGGGPRITHPLAGEADLERFQGGIFENPVVCESLRQVRAAVGPDVPILGFTGAPFTLATYAVEGEMSKDQGRIRKLVFENPALLHEIMERLTVTVASYLVAQVRDGGADGVQLFESWGSILPMPGLYHEYGTRYHRRVIDLFRRECPTTPVILYVRGSAGKIPTMASTGADVLGLDQYTSMDDARSLTGLCLQGNLDPMLMSLPDRVPAAVEELMDSFDWRRGWIANLGHGITPQGNADAVRAMIQTVRAVAARDGA